MLEATLHRALWEAAGNCGRQEQETVGFEQEINVVYFLGCPVFF